MIRARIAAIKSGDLFNPLLVREIRQSVRSKAFSSGIILTSVICLVIMACGMIWTAKNGYISQSSDLGRNIFAIIYFILWTILCIAIPFSSATRFRNERKKGEFELFRITGISPKRIIMGKLQASLSQALLLSFVAAPFMMTCYLLRGISALDIFILLFVVFVLAIGLTQIGIFMGSLNLTTPFFSLLNIVYVLSLIWTYVVYGMLISEGWERVMNEIGVGNEVIMFLSTILIYLYWFIFLFLATVAMINDDNTDTTFSLRMLTLLAVMFIPPIFIFFEELHEVAQIVFYLCFTIPVLVAAMLVYAKPKVSDSRLNFFWKNRYLRPFKLIMYCARPNFFLWFSVVISFCGLWEYLYGQFCVSTADKTLHFILVTGTMVFLWAAVGNFILSLICDSIPTVAKSLLGCLIPSLIALFLANVDEGFFSYLICPFTTFYAFTLIGWECNFYFIFASIWIVIFIASLILAIFDVRKRNTERL
jgi:ABC-type transport system involved in cytochrome c biogenesis permease component